MTHHLVLLCGLPAFLGRKQLKWLCFFSTLAPKWQNLLHDTLLCHCLYLIHLVQSALTGTSDGKLLVTRSCRYTFLDPCSLRPHRDFEQYYYACNLQTHVTPRKAVGPFGNILGHNHCRWLHMVGNIINELQLMSKLLTIPMLHQMFILYYITCLAKLVAELQHTCSLFNKEAASLDGFSPCCIIIEFMCIATIQNLISCESY